MNFDTDFDAFCTALDDLWAIKGQALTAGAKGAFFRALEDQPLQVVRAALTAHARDPERGRFLPMPADVIAQIRQLEGSDGRPGAEEAWAMALRSRDEAETVVWTREMAEAWGVARQVLQLGDEVGARMAFREAYGRLVDGARRQRIPAEWTVSEGFDSARRADAIRTAVDAGLLSGTELQALPPPARGTVLEFAGETAASESARKVALALADRLRNPPEVVSYDRLERERTEQLKAATAERVREYADRAGDESNA